MHTSIFSFAALASVLVAAIPTEPVKVHWKAPKVGDKFGIAATGKGISNIDLTASKGRIFIGGKQNPSCDRGVSQASANFRLNEDSSISLYKTDNPPQDLWAKWASSGGYVGYTTGVQPPPAKSRRTGFKVNPDTRVLTFNGFGGKACPTGEDHKWSLWFTDSGKPGYLNGCVDVVLKASVRDAAVSCLYSEGPNEE